MYYEEKWINRKLCWRSTPAGEWIPFTIGQYKDRVIKLEQKVKNLTLPCVSESVQPVGEGLVCGLGMKTSECERYNVVKTCNHCPWYS
jgi:hypothetical protein